MKAYPQAQFRGDEPVDTEEHGGMDLRDYFAAKAMIGFSQAVIDPKSCDAVLNISNKNGNKPEQTVAKMAYDIADAMMEARK